MLGMIQEDDHPYSWSAIINGFEPQSLAHCPNPVIRQYLSARSPEMIGIPLAKVTHIWTDDPSDARQVARMAGIPHIVSRAADVIGKVDAVIIATDDGDDHVHRCEEFVAAGLPIFVDKPLATNLADLAKFIAWRKQGAVIVSSSGFRFAAEVAPLRGQPWRWITATTCKNWKRYGIHALEPVFTVTGPGFTTVTARRQSAALLSVELEHRDGTRVSISIIEKGFGSAFVLHAYGDQAHHAVEIRDSYTAFRGQLLSFLGFAAGQAPEPQPFSETVEIMAVLIAAQRSVDQGGQPILVSVILDEVASLSAR